MRFIPTFDQKVEQLKTEAKKLQRKGGGKHADLLNRIARSAGYDHWHHVIQCNKQTMARKGAEALLAECAAVVDAEQKGEIKVVMTGPNVDNAIGPFILFSTGIGDAWMLDPEDDLCLCLMWRGQVNEPQIGETPKQLKISWDGKYDLIGDFMHLRPFDERIRARAVAGYPLQGIRSLIHRAQSFQRKFASVIEQEDAIDLTEPVIYDLVRQGWDLARVREFATAGFRYSPSRNSMLSPIAIDEDLFVEDDEQPPPLNDSEAASL